MKRSLGLALRGNRMLLVVAALFAAIFGLRVADGRAGDAILILCVVPIVVCAIDRGPAGGVVASLVGLGLTALWARSGGADVGALGYGARAVAFVVVGVVVGRSAEHARARERRL